MTEYEGGWLVGCGLTALSAKTRLYRAMSVLYCLGKHTASYTNKMMKDTNFLFSLGFVEIALPQTS